MTQPLGRHVLQSYFPWWWYYYVVSLKAREKEQGRSHRRETPLGEDTMNHVQCMHSTIICPLKYHRILLLNLFKGKNSEKKYTELQIRYFKVLFIKPLKASLVITVNSACLGYCIIIHWSVCMHLLFYIYISI